MCYHYRYIIGSLMPLYFLNVAFLWPKTEPKTHPSDCCTLYNVYCTLHSAHNEESMTKENEENDRFKRGLRIRIQTRILLNPDPGYYKKIFLKYIFSQSACRFLYPNFRNNLRGEFDLFILDLDPGTQKSFHLDLKPY